MAIARRRQPQRREQQPLSGGVAQVILAAQHMRDTHQRIVERVAEKERRTAVLAPDDEVADVVGQETLCTMHQVLELDALSARHPKAQARLASLRQARRALGGAQLAAGSGVARRAAGGQLRAPRQIQLELAAEARIRQPLAFEPLKVLLVERGALRLTIGPMRTGAIRSLVPIQSQPR